VSDDRLQVASREISCVAFDIRVLTNVQTERHGDRLIAVPAVRSYKYSYIASDGPAPPAGRVNCCAV